MKKVYFLFTLFALLSLSQLHAQNADPGILISFQPPSITQGNSGSIVTTISNNGATVIPAGCAVVTISVPSIGKITGLATGSDPNFTATILGGGSSIRIINTAGPLAVTSAYNLSVVVQGLTIGGPSDIKGNITYDPTGSCASAGNLNTVNDNSTTSMAVSANPLPVSLLSFTATPQADHTVKLNWITTSENGNDYFLLERSKDLLQVDPVARVKASEGGSQGHNYTYIDEQPYIGTSYYRLSQFDLDGRSTSYLWISVVMRSQDYGVYPNPILNGQRFNLALDEPETALIGLYNAEGRWVPLQKTGIDTGNLGLKSDQKLPAGVYILRVEERAQTRKHRLVVE